MADTPHPKTPPVKKPPVKPVAKPASQPKPKSQAAPVQSSPLFWVKKAWKKLDDWNVGMSGKVIIILMILGLLSEIYHKL